MSRIIHRNVETRCATCGGEGTVIEFRRSPGEYMAGEPVEVECEECCGSGSWTDEPVTVRPAYTPSPEYLAWCEKVDGDPVPKRMRAA